MRPGMRLMSDPIWRVVGEPCDLPYGSYREKSKWKQGLRKWAYLWRG
jgi:hypothetical protein